MYGTISEWNQCTNNLEDFDGHGDIYNPGVGSVFTTNQFHELTLPARTNVDEYVWINPDIEESVIHLTPRILDGLSTAQIFSEPDYSYIQNYWNGNDREHFNSHCSQIHTQNRNSNTDQTSLNVSDLSMNNDFQMKPADSSLVSHTTTSHGVWVVPNKDANSNMEFINRKPEHTPNETSIYIEAGNSEIHRRFNLPRQRPDIIEGARKKIDNYKYKNNDEFSMLIASGGVPLGRLDEVGCVEWYPERQSWKVIGHTGISWCVRRKTWRVWFITSGGTRATRSFNPKEHGTVAAALKAAIEFLEHKRAEQNVQIYIQAIW
ncbi:hypothetical protein OJ253_1212 [Cryptosporidium canis]|uniref:AP2 domain-containing protein n=1 Tax=Cryptosporidium canis TaxID=195482 RepID=A0A9D5HXR0_9CRYT|nr:hypothetical protein OJ253_1212 [Cryptosporidium canis]